MHVGTKRTHAQIITRVRVLITFLHPGELPGYHPASKHFKKLLGFGNVFVYCLFTGGGISCNLLWVYDSAIANEKLEIIQNFNIYKSTTAFF